MDKPANHNNCKADACFGDRREWLQPPAPSPIPERADWGMVDPSALREWLKAQVGIYLTAAHQNPDPEGNPDEYFLGKHYTFRQVLAYLDHPTDPPGCDGDEYHENPNNPEVNYGDGKAMGIKGLKL